MDKAQTTIALNKNDDLSSQPGAVPKIVRTKNPETIVALKDSLKGEHALIRAAAYKNFISIGKPAIPALLTTLESPQIDCYVQDALRAIGTPAAQSLIKALKNEVLKNNAGTVLISLDNGSVSPLVRGLKDPELVEEISVILCSLHLRGNQVVQPLVNALSFKRLRPGAVHALTDIILDEVLGKRDFLLLYRILGEGPTRKVFSRHFLNVPQLIPAFVDISGNAPSEPSDLTIPTQKMAQKMATSLLIKIGQPAVGSLINSLSRDNTRKTSQKILTRIGRPALPALIEVADSQADIDVRALTVLILGDIGASEANATLVNLLKQNSGIKVQKECANSLGKIDDPAVLRDLLVALENQELEPDVASVIAKSPLIRKALKTFNKISKKCYCSKCLHRVIAKKSVYNKNHFIVSHICRKCGSVSQVVDAINHVVLVLDSTLPAIPPNNNLLSLKEMDHKSHKSTLYINWVWHKDPFDFDEVQLKDNNEIEIEEFMVKLRNDTDDQRRRRIRSLPVKIYPNLVLTKAQSNALKDTFKKIHYRPK